MSFSSCDQPDLLCAHQLLTTIAEDRECNGLISSTELDAVAYNRLHAGLDFRIGCCHYSIPQRGRRRRCVHRSLFVLAMAPATPLILNCEESLRHSLKVNERYGLVTTAIEPDFWAGVLTVGSTVRLALLGTPTTFAWDERYFNLAD